MTDGTTQREQPVARENVLFSACKRQGSYLHVLRGERRLSPAASDEVLFIHRTMPDVAALARERAELEQRAARLRGLESRAKALAAELAG